MCFFQQRCPDALRTKQPDQFGQRFMQLCWIAQRNLEKTKLLPDRFRRLRFELDSENWMLRSKILEMDMQHAEEHLLIVRRLRNFKDTFILRFVIKTDP